MKQMKKLELIKLMMQKGFGLSFVMIAALTIMAIAPDVQAEEKSDLKISGFIDFSFSDASDGFGTFSLDQVEVDLEKQLAPNLSARADLQFGLDGCASCEATGDDKNSSFGVEQGYVTYSPFQSIEITAGLFLAPIGFESLDPVDMYQYSHGLVFTNGLPVSLTGLMVSASPHDMLDVSVYVVNGWDLITDNNNSKTVGGRLGITPVDGVNIGFSVITGPESAMNEEDVTTVFDIDLTVTAIDKLTIGAEFNTGETDNASVITTGMDASWVGYSFMANYSILDSLGATFRYEIFDDEDGSRLGAVGGKAQEQDSITLALAHSLGDGAIVIAEVRQNGSDQKAWNSGQDDSQTIYALEFTYSF